jgi:hypothetical protein
VDTSPWVNKLQKDLIEIFKADSSVEILGVTDEFPF